LKERISTLAGKSKPERIEMNTAPTAPPKRALVLAASALCFLPTLCLALILNVSQCYQEQDQWCWAASSQSVLAFYGTSLTQTQIAQYGTGGTNIWNYLYGSDATRTGVDLILGHFGSISSSAFASALTQTDVQSEIDTNGRPIVIRWGWDSGGGHILVLNGLVSGTAYLMDPWYGPTINSYDWVVQGSSHTWTHSLKLITNPVAISVSPASQNFGSIQFDTTADRNFTVTNPGGGTLNGIASVSSPFSVVAGSPYSLGANQNTTITIRYSPISVGSNSQTATFTGGGGATRPVTGAAYLPPPQNFHVLSVQ
jgi:Papain-like cysteine protease AvrRpt2